MPAAAEARWLPRRLGSTGHGPQASDPAIPHGSREAAPERTRLGGCPRDVGPKGHVPGYGVLFVVVAAGAVAAAGAAGTAGAEPVVVAPAGAGAFVPSGKSCSL